MASRTKESELKCSYQSYDLDGWEGGIAVFWMRTPSGGSVIAIPRLSLSTFLIGTHNQQDVHDMLTRNRTLYFDRKSLDTLERYIMRDFCA